MYNVYRPLIVYVMATPFVSLARVCVRACALACVNARFFLSFGCHADAWFPVRMPKRSTSLLCGTRSISKAEPSPRLSRRFSSIAKDWTIFLKVWLLCCCAGALVCWCVRVATALLTAVRLCCKRQF